MFGVVPKSIWSKTNPPDELNLCTWSMRSLLLRTGQRNILIDCGIGNKQSEKFFSYYYLHGEDSLLKSLKNVNLSPEDITDVFLTHLHFDHCGGGIERKDGKLKTVFPNATYWSNESHWTWATQPNDRENASFISENILPIQESGQLKMVSGNNWEDIFEVLYVSGHTSHMMVPMIPYGSKTLCFMADLLPSVGHIPLPYVMGYDTQPLLTLREKKSFLEQAATKDYILFLQHDEKHECATVHQTEKGVRLKSTFTLKEFIEKTNKR